MPISHYSSGKYGDSSSSTNNGSSNSYYSRSRDSASERGRERDKDWGSSSRGREWRRDRDRSRERDRDKERQRSPSRTSRFAADYNNSGSSSRDRERRQQDKYYSTAASARSPPPPGQDDPVPRRVSRFGTAGGKYSESRSGGYSGQATVSYSTASTAGATPSLIREKDLLQNPGLTNSILHGDQYGSYHFSSQSHFSDFPSYSSLDQRSSSHQDKNPKDDPLFKAAVDALIMNMKTRGDYDQVRKECFSDIDTKAAFINLHARIKSTVDKYLGLQVFTKDMDKVKTREGMRKKILDTPYFEKGIESVVNQILTPKINSLIRPKVEEEVFKYLKVDRNGEDKDLQNQLTNEPKSENHTKHESIETREIMLPNSPIYKDVNDRPKRLLSKEIGMNEVSEDTMPSPSIHDNPPYRVAPPMENSNLTRADSDMSESSSEKSLEIDLDARSEVMDESSGTTRQEEEGPRTPPEPELSTMPDTQAAPPPPPPPPPITTSSSALANVTHPSCSIPNMSIAPPYGAFAGHIPHFGMGVHPSAHGIMEHSLSLGSMTHTAGIPPPLPPLPPSSGEHLPPPPPSPPKPQIPPPPPPPMCDDDACSSPPGGSRMLIPNDEEDEPLPPGEEPDSYFSQMRANKISPPKFEDKPDMPPPPPPEPVEVDLADIKLPGEDSEEATDAEEEEIEEEDSEEESPMFEKLEEVSPPRVVVMDSEEEESPMFEKICEVSPPRPVELQNSALVQELTKELLGEEVDTNGNKEDEQREESDPTTTTVPERRSSNSSSCSSNECKYLESIPEFDYKVLFYKRIPDS